MNPQLEYLEIDWCIHGELTTLLSALLNPSRGLTLPSGATFPGPSLKYFRLVHTGVSYDVQNYEVALSKYLVSLLTKVPHLKLDVVVWKSPPGFEGLMKRFPSRVKLYQRVDSVPLFELHEISEGL